MSAEAPQTVAPKVPAIYRVMQSVMGELAQAGVGKDKENTTQNFMYRGVDDVMNALAPLIAKFGLLILPRVLQREMTERTSRAGGALLHVVLKMEYELIAVEDASALILGPLYGEAMDSGDKATNKALSSAYKYACIQAFCIPIAGADDPDAETPEVDRTPERAPPAPARTLSPAPRASASGDKSGAAPLTARPTGPFSYGKKYFNTPWREMTTSQLEWFRDQASVAPSTREKCVAELAWRDYEASQLDAARTRQAQEEAPPDFDDNVPM